MFSDELTAIGSQNNKKVPKVSIIVNCWNGEAFLKEAIDSTLSQTFKDWELILFDDRSTDRSAEIFKSYEDPRFYYFLADDALDLTAARKEAIKHARGDWLAFLDQDDIWVPDKLERQLHLLTTTDADKVGLVYGRAKRFGFIDEGRDFDHHFEGRDLPELTIFNDLAMVANFIPMSSAMLRRSAYDEMEPVPENVRLCPDYYYWMAISRHWQVLALQETCCLYRVRGSDFFSSNGIQIFTEFLNVIEYFGDEISPRSLKLKRRSCHNLIGVAEIAAKLPFKGIKRIITQGSFISLSQQVLSYFFRSVNYLFSQRKK